MSATVQFGRPHPEAAAFLRGKPAVAREVFDQLLPELRARAFTVTGLAATNVLEALRDQIAGLAEGRTWDDVKATVADHLPFLGEGADARAELLLRTHGFQAFQAATWRAAQLDADTTHLQYLTMEDDRVRPGHRALDGLVLPKDDPFWDTHTPPWDWGCRCRLRPLNPDQVAQVRAADRDRPPEAQRVLEGPALAQLRLGRRITPDGQAVDVTPPADRPAGAAAFGWNPRTLALPLEQLQGRYTPEVWRVFAAWAARTELAPGVTVYRWLSQPGLLNLTPPALQTWRQRGLPPARQWPPAPPPRTLPAEDARRQLQAGVTVRDPLGGSVRFEASLLDHWEAEAAKDPADVQRRLQLLPEALRTVEAPQELWQQGPVNVYLRRAGEVYFVAVLARTTGAVRTFFATRNTPYVDRLRQGLRLWPA